MLAISLLQKKIIQKGLLDTFLFNYMLKGLLSYDFDEIQNNDPDLGANKSINFKILIEKYSIHLLNNTFFTFCMNSEVEISEEVDSNKIMLIGDFEAAHICIDMSTNVVTLNDFSSHEKIATLAKNETCFMEILIVLSDYSFDLAYGNVIDKNQYLAKLISASGLENASNIYKSVLGIWD